MSVMKNRIFRRENSENGERQYLFSILVFGCKNVIWLKNNIDNRNRKKKTTLPLNFGLQHETNLD